ncbi:relaxase/mobilization nuclease domain-containing protein [Sulfitobacter sp. D35]|uniref:relaxase/mobilization nuclease domain-containing protein n=1 Tax=Sulfitobacter sp. D35 TaxID=3083252 RepID=UPI00296F075B|nr:relaxase/mobilization nuclease domain-containing protein [Sulfitobacter sp. D35]MDW4500305.1 relaxase/mobilization nuclease domain-containing protein [Sulfitobacter sp. D35]
MRLNDAVHDVTGEVFRDGWSRIRGSMQGLHVAKQRQLIRAAAGHRAAVFKAIRGGGTHTKSQLSNQLGYLTTKSAHIVDSSGFLDGKTRLEPAEIKDLAERFAKRWSAGFKPKLGQTTHMLMSFPIGTRGEDVRDITANVAERFFQTDEGHFDYIIAVHEDRAHPHAHIVLNRRSQEGEFFFLGRDHRFNYDDFRLAMVEEAERFGFRLEATRRIDRGVLHYPPRTREVYAAKDEGRAPEPRPRVGADLKRALAEIANTRTVYHALATEASREAREDIADALFRAGQLLATGGRLGTEGGVYMAEDQTFEDLRTRYADQVARVQGMIEGKPEVERPRFERSLNEIQARLAHMQPLGLRSVTLTERPSEGGIYSEANIDRDQLVRLREPDVRAQIDTALRGTGIRASVVIARMETGAQNAALERQWIADDLARVAETDGLNLERRADLETARDALNRAHVQLGIALERASVLREDGVMDAETISERFHYHREAAEAMEGTIRREMRAEGMTDQQIEDRDWQIASRAELRIETEQRAYIDAHPHLLARPGEVIDRSEPFREHITDEDRVDEIAREVDRIMAERDVRTPVAEAVTDDFRARYPDMPSHLARGLGATYAAVVEARDTVVLNQVRRETEMRERLGDSVIDAAQDARLAERRATEVAGQPVRDAELRRVIAHERSGDLSEPFLDAEERLAFRDAVESELDADQIDRLRGGDVDILKPRIGDRLDRLYAAKVYLQSDAATANSDATRAVVEEIADREYERHRADLHDGESECGETH